MLLRRIYMTKMKITPEFSMDEFSDSSSAISLCETLLTDGIAINQKNVDALNKILELEDLFVQSAISIRASSRHSKSSNSSKLLKSQS